MWLWVRSVYALAALIEQPKAPAPPNLLVALDDSALLGDVHLDQRDEPLDMERLMDDHGSFCL